MNLPKGTYVQYPTAGRLDTNLPDVTHIRYPTMYCNETKPP